MGALSAGEISHRLAAVRARIADAAHACGRSPTEITLVAVSKRHDEASIRAAYAAGQAACVGHVAEHDLGAAAYAIKAVAAAAPNDPAAGSKEREWQRSRLPVAVRDLVLEDQERRNALCWGVFSD